MTTNICYGSVACNGFAEPVQMGVKEDWMLSATVPAYDLVQGTEHLGYYVELRTVYNAEQDLNTCSSGFLHRNFIALLVTEMWFGWDSL